MPRSEVLPDATASHHLTIRNHRGNGWFLVTACPLLSNKIRQGDPFNVNNILTTDLSKYCEEFARFELERFYALVSLVAHLEFGKGREIWSIVQHIHHVYTHCCVYTRVQEVKFRATAELNAAIELLTLLTMSAVVQSDYSGPYFNFVQNYNPFEEAVTGSDKTNYVPFEFDVNELSSNGIGGGGSDETNYIPFEFDVNELSSNGIRGGGSDLSLIHI